MIQKKFTDDISKFNNYQANRWKNLQEKLDSVHVSSKLKDPRIEKFSN